MFGFQSLISKGAKMIIKSNAFKIHVFKPQHLAWSYQQISNALSRCQPIPISGLLLLNLRSLFEKCSTQCEAQSDVALNGNIFLEQITVLSRISCLDIVGISTPQLVMRLRQIDINH